jgi:hypothetical protein
MAEGKKAPQVAGRQPRALVPVVRKTGEIDWAGAGRLCRHRLDCFVPDQKRNQGNYRTMVVTPEIIAAFRRCEICGGE